MGKPWCTYCKCGVAMSKMSQHCTQYRHMGARAAAEQAGGVQQRLSVAIEEWKKTAANPVQIPDSALQYRVGVVIMS